MLAAAAEQAGFLPFRVGHISHSGGNSLGVAAGPSESQLMVPSFPLDALLHGAALQSWPAMHQAWQQRRLVIKIDVEGFEATVLQGMQRLLHERRASKVIVEVNQERSSALGQSFDVDAFMARHGYRPSVPPTGRRHFDQCYLPQA